MTNRIWPQGPQTTKIQWPVIQGQPAKKTNLADDVEQQFCVCAESYQRRGLIDPNCQAHDIADYIRGANKNV